MQQRSIIISAIVLAIAVSLGILYLLTSPAINTDPETTPRSTIIPTPTSTPLVIIPNELTEPQPTASPDINGASITAETGTGTWIFIVMTLAILFGSFNLVKQIKKA